jgi:hypothetical protein
MAAPSHYTEQEWQTARDLVAAGMVIREVAERTEISYDALRQRISREDWFVPATALAEAKAVLAQAAQDKQIKDQDNQSGNDCSSQNVTKGLEMAENLLEIGKEGALLVARGLLPTLRRTYAPDSALMNREIQSHKEAGAAFGTFAKATQLDKPQHTVSLNFWGGSGSAKTAPCWEAQEADGPNLEDETQ